MIIVTGGAGMIGSNIVHSLNKRGIKEIIIVDNLQDGKKVRNISDLDFYDFIDKDDFFEIIKKGGEFKDVTAILHQGACSSTTNWDGKYIMKNNYEYSKILMEWCQIKNAQLIYASSASVYGNGNNGFDCIRDCENPINMYAFSKFQFDQYFRANKKHLNSQVVSLRYFNVYGPREQHKNSMASTIYHFNNQILNNNDCKLFEGTNGYENGAQRRDFVFVDDCVSVNLWFLNNPNVSGIFNVGTGKAETFNKVAENIINWHQTNKNIKCGLSYIPFPNELRGSYQNFTQANINSLREAGYDKKFYDLKTGINKYLDYLNS